jgi:hypothetical protein
LNYEGARQRKNGYWDWAVTNSRMGTYPTAYCAGWTVWSEETARLLNTTISALERDQVRRHGHVRGKFHVNGHPTKQDAERCYYEFCLDHLQEFERPDIQRCCQVCTAWTSKGLHEIEIGGWFMSPVWLCDDHRTVDHVRHLIPFSEGMSSAYS